MVDGYEENDEQWLAETLTICSKGKTSIAARILELMVESKLDMMGETDENVRKYSLGICAKWRCEEHMPCGFLKMMDEGFIINYKCKKLAARYVFLDKLIRGIALGFPPDYEAVIGYYDNLQKKKEAHCRLVNRLCYNYEELHHTRTGRIWRNGDVSAEEFMNHFRFRGVEFGNWENQVDRQENLNLAFDALNDMAAAMSVAPAYLSLEGRLGVAFGSRGSGSASAHYEP